MLCYCLFWWPCALCCPWNEPVIGIAEAAMRTASYVSIVWSQPYNAQWIWVGIWLWGYTILQKYSSLWYCSWRLSDSNAYRTVRDECKKAQIKAMQLFWAVQVWAIYVTKRVGSNRYWWRCSSSQTMLVQLNLKTSKVGDWALQRVTQAYCQNLEHIRNKLNSNSNRCVGIETAKNQKIG